MTFFVKVVQITIYNNPFWESFYKELKKLSKQFITLIFFFHKIFSKIMY